MWRQYDEGLFEAQLHCYCTVTAVELWYVGEDRRVTKMKARR